MSLKTFFQPWTIPPNPALSWLSGPDTEYDPLQDAFELSVAATSWVTDAVDQLTYANDLYKDAAENAKAEIAYQRERRSVALNSIVINNDLIRLVTTASQSPLPAEGQAVTEDAPVETPALDDLMAQPVPWYVPAVEPEPVAPSRRRPRRTTVKEEQP